MYTKYVQRDREFEYEVLKHFSDLPTEKKDVNPFFYLKIILFYDQNSLNLKI